MGWDGNWDGFGGLWLVIGPGCSLQGLRHGPQRRAAVEADVR